MPKTIFARAYIRKNLGDDIFIEILLQRYPDTTFIITGSQEYYEIFSYYKNLKILSPPVPNIIIRLINKICRYLYGRNIITNITYKASFYEKIVEISDGTVLIGGSLFKEGRRAVICKDNIEDYCVFRIFKNLPQYIIGSNFGPFENQKYYDLYNDIFKQLTDVCFREEYSAKLFSHLPNVRNCPDVVFQYQVPKVKKRNRTTGISVIDLEGREKLQNYESDYLSKIRELITYKSHMGYEVHLFSFCKEEGDELVVEKILQKLPVLLRDKIIVEKYSGNIHSFLEKYGVMEEMYASRFHAVILSFLFNQKTYPLIYSNKISNVLDDMNYNGNSCRICDIASVHVNDMIALPVDYMDLDAISKRAKGQFLMLDKLLK